MKDPNRWRDANSGADAETRALLQNPPVASPSRREADEIWAGLSAHLDITFAPPGPDGSQLGPTGPVHSPPMGPVAAAAGTGVLVAKATLAVALLATIGGVVGTRVVSSRHSQARAMAPKTATIQARALLPLAPSPILTEPPVQQPAPIIPRNNKEPQIRPCPEKTTRPSRLQAALGTTTPGTIAPSTTTPGTTTPSTTTPGTITPSTTTSTMPAVAPQPSMMEDRSLPPPTRISPTAPLVTGPVVSAPISVNELLEEGRRLDRARLALRAHDPDRALQLLGEGSIRTNQLAQEREALTIEAEAAKPALRASAFERATVFMRVYPNSPYRARITGIISGSQ